MSTAEAEGAGGEEEEEERAEEALCVCEGGTTDSRCDGTGRCWAAGRRVDAVGGGLMEAAATSGEEEREKTMAEMLVTVV